MTLPVDAALRWPERAALALYGAVTTALQPALRVKLALRARAEPGYGEAIAQRFGHYADEPSSGWLWVHAVSLGETRAAALWVQRLRQRWPEVRVLWTHGTATGRAEGQRHLRPGDAQAWLPWDAPGPVARFLAHFQPRVGVLMETEVWPVLTAACAGAGMPLLLVNARCNERMARRAQRLAWLARPAYRRLYGVWAQTAEDADRLQTLAAPVLPPRGGVMGNVKFDIPWHPHPWEQGRAWRAAWRAQTATPQAPDGRPILLLASSREGEEAAWSAAWRRQVRQRAATAAPLWLVVPRHPQRFDAVEAALRQQGWRVVRRSTLGPLQAAPHWPSAFREADVLLGDSLGEMPWYYALADVALLGGSFGPHGGQNLIEAAACECPVVVGPHTFNFAFAADAAIEAGAARRATDMDDAVAQAWAWLQAPQARSAAQRAGAALLAAHGGAAERCAAVVGQVWARRAARALNAAAAGR
ncbi:3-deoxy-D-manno-octulosonic acid transferase [Tepidimonas charontis]|uniref:3-deoxy-D-manno-octulosonic acid transferase n=1 Tax=Tepidimonas charontis TaxID=2267262 RepID=UPI001F1C4442|nr:3-deoxy-D-manno-octulosonic acid transferase [Tepidimonas charontis]